MKVAQVFTRSYNLKVSPKRWPILTVTDNRTTTFIFFSWYSNWSYSKWINQAEQERLFGLDNFQTFTLRRESEYNTINWRDTTHFDSEDDYR